MLITGYYNLPEEITVVGCWAHARRKFDYAVKFQGNGKGSCCSGIGLLQSSV